MSAAPLRIVVLGLSITSTWGNGHATTYRALIKGLQRRGHDVLFLERDTPWYARHRDLPEPPWCRTVLYQDLDELRTRHAAAVRDADLVVVGSYVPEGVGVGRWVTDTARGTRAFYDIDTPVTLARLARGDDAYLDRALVRRYDLYLSFTGGPTLARLEREFGAERARALYCSVDPELYTPLAAPPRWDLGYLGTWAADRQPALDRLLLAPAARLRERAFVVAGSQYPSDIEWPPNVERIDHVPAAEHARFYGTQRWTVNVTRADMVAAGWSPSVRLFEAAACGTPIISDAWAGLDQLFVRDREIRIAHSADDVLAILRDIDDAERARIGAAARARVLAEHTGDRRARQLEEYVLETADRR